jgi:hypothetical protein
MMERPLNIYSAVAFDLHSKIRNIIDDLNKNGQIDHDDHGHPYVIAIENVGGANRRIDFIRAGKQENILVNTRRRTDPIRSFNPNDGYKRMDMPRLPTMRIAADRRERQKRDTFESIVDQIFEE